MYIVAFVNIPILSEKECKEIANLLNKFTGPQSPRAWKVVNNDYKLQPGFEP